MITDLKEIGFYTLSNQRAATASHRTPLQRCEIVLTSRCNFNCPYCRHVGGKDIPLNDAVRILQQWVKEGVQNVRFSGGEPTLYPGIYDLVATARDHGVKRIAISTNGSAEIMAYYRLLKMGVNDFSISLDACCAEDGDKMAGGVKGSWNRVVHTIWTLARLTYVTVGVVLTADNGDRVSDIIKFADSLGVSDIRVIPAAQHGQKLGNVEVSMELLQKYPILRYRFNNLCHDVPVRGLSWLDSHRCGLVLDDIAVCQNKHYPCIIYLREGGDPIGVIGPSMRYERREWFRSHDTHCDPICKKNCLDVCRDYNNVFAARNPSNISCVEKVFSFDYETTERRVLCQLSEEANGWNRQEPSDAGTQGEQ